MAFSEEPKNELSAVRRAAVAAVALPGGLPTVTSVAAAPIHL